MLNGKLGKIWLVDLISVDFIVILGIIIIFIIILVSYEYVRLVCSYKN